MTEGGTSKAQFRRGPRQSLQQVAHKLCVGQRSEREVVLDVLVQPMLPHLGKTKNDLETRKECLTRIQWAARCMPSSAPPHGRLNCLLGR